MSDVTAEVKIPRGGKWLKAAIRFVGLGTVRIIYRFRKVNPERIPRTGGVLLLPNHVTFADAFFITAACPRPVRFVMDDGFMAHPAIRWFCNVFETVTISKSQPREAIRLTIDALKDGALVCFFPEGQLSRTGTLNELRRGVELIAKKSGAPLVPMWMDGAWGSIFSFERGRFFRKLPYRLPHPLTSAFGEPLAPETVTLESLRTAILKTAASAIRRNFPEGTPEPQINGYQIGQIGALARRTPFAALKGDPLIAELPSLFDSFSQQFGSLAEYPETLDGPRSWVGGEALRQRIESGPATDELDFYDFSERAAVPLEIAGVRHLPCLAIGGRVISMSMPDPQVPRSTAEFQRGGKPGTLGKLLPGWYIEDGFVKGPAAERGLALPAGAFLDAEGFVAIG